MALHRSIVILLRPRSAFHLKKNHLLPTLDKYERLNKRFHLYLSQRQTPRRLGLEFSGRSSWTSHARSHRSRRKELPGGEGAKASNPCSAQRQVCSTDCHQWSMTESKELITTFVMRSLWLFHHQESLFLSPTPSLHFQCSNALPGLPSTTGAVAAEAMCSSMLCSHHVLCTLQCALCFISSSATCSNVLQRALTCSNVQRDDGQSSGPGLALTLREGAI